MARLRQIHLGTSPGFYYNTRIMPVMSIIFWLATLGAPPNLSLPDIAEPPGGEVLGQRLLAESYSAIVNSPQPLCPTKGADSLPMVGVELSIRDRQGSDPFVGQSPPQPLGQSFGLPDEWPRFRAQSPEDEIPEFEMASPDPRGIHRELFYELLDTFNPMAKTTVRVLPGYYDPYGWQGSYGTNGYQSWRLGWSIYHEAAVMPSSMVSGGTTGEMKIVEWNSNGRISEIIAPGILFNGTGYFNAHYWDGPGGLDLGPQVDQISADMELGFFNDGPWSGQIAFHPQIVDGYDSKLNHNALNYDGRAIAMYMASPNWSFVGGLAVWDRVDLMFVPHVGAIWTPDTRWELRLLYPKTKISYYLGRSGKKDFWLYGTAEYTAEAWQANIGDPTMVNDRIQITDDRVSLGLRWDSGRHSLFVEGGYAFNRQAKFGGKTPGFDISNVGMVRIGARF